MSPVKNTIKLPVRIGRFLGRTLDPRRRESLEDSLRIRNTRWEERQAKLADRAADDQQEASSAPTTNKTAYDAEQRKGRRRIRSWAGEVVNLIDFGGVLLRLLSVIVRGVVRLIGGLLDGLSTFDT